MPIGTWKCNGRTNQPKDGHEGSYGRYTWNKFKTKFLVRLRNLKGLYKVTKFVSWTYMAGFFVFSLFSLDVKRVFHVVLFVFICLKSLTLFFINSHLVCLASERELFFNFIYYHIMWVKDIAIHTETGRWV